MMITAFSTPMRTHETRILQKNRARSNSGLFFFFAMGGIGTRCLFYGEKRGGFWRVIRCGGLRHPTRAAELDASRIPLPERRERRGSGHRWTQQIASAGRHRAKQPRRSGLRGGSEQVVRAAGTEIQKENSQPFLRRKDRGIPKYRTAARGTAHKLKHDGCAYDAPVSNEETKNYQEEINHEV